MNENTAIFLVTLAMVACVGWVVQVISNSRRRSRIAELQRDLHAKLFEKFGTSQELVEYLKTEAGSKFLDSAIIEHAKPFGRVLGSIHAGLILFLLGTALVAVRGMLPQGAFLDAEGRAMHEAAFLILGMLFLAVGTGFLASALVSYWLSKKWGLLERESGRQR